MKNRLQSARGRANYSMKSYAERYSEGTPARILADENGVSVSAMLKRLRSDGCQIRTQGKYSDKRPERTQNILDALKKGDKTQTEIAYEFGVTRQAVSLIAKRNEIKPLAFISKREKSKLCKANKRAERFFRKQQRDEAIQTALSLAIPEIRSGSNASEIKELIKPLVDWCSVSAFLSKCRKKGWDIPKMQRGAPSHKSKRARDPMRRVKMAARMKVYTEIRAGRMSRLPCSVCGDPKAHGHHSDYSKPLEVEWLCEKHHKNLHKTLDAQRKCA